MGYQLRLHSEIREWLTDLRHSEPECGRLVGEAVVALLDAGETLGPPLAVPWSRCSSRRMIRGRPSTTPTSTSWRSCRRCAAVSLTWRPRGSASSYRAVSSRRVPRSWPGSAGTRSIPGMKNLAEEAGTREAGVQEQLSGLRHQLSVLQRKEERLIRRQSAPAGKVDAFRIRKETINASYTADEASRAVREAFAENGEDASDLELPDEQAEEPDALSGTPIAASEVLEMIPDLERATQPILR